MSAYEWFQITQTIIMALAALLVLSVKVGLKGGSLDVILQRLDNLDERMNRAGIKMSDLADDVQGLPDRLRKEFLPREEAKLLFDLHNRRQRP